MKGILRLPAVLFLILVAGQTLLFGETNENEKRNLGPFGLKFGFSAVNENFDALISLDLCLCDGKLPFYQGVDVLKFKFKVFGDRRQAGVNLNWLITISSFVLAGGAALSQNGAGNQLEALFWTIFIMNLPSCLLNYNCKYFLFDRRFSLDFNTEGDLYVLDNGLLFEESVAAGVSVYFNDLLSLQMTAKMVFYSDRFYFDAEHFGLGASLRLSF